MVGNRNARRIKVMNAPLKAVTNTGALEATMLEIGRNARDAARTLALAAPARKNRALGAMAAAIRASRAAILAANAEDVAEAKSSGVAAAFLDRLTLDAKRVEPDSGSDGIHDGVHSADLMEFDVFRRDVMHLAFGCRQLCKYLRCEAFYVRPELAVRDHP